MQDSSGKEKKLKNAEAETMEFFSSLIRDSEDENTRASSKPPYQRDAQWDMR